MDAAENPAITGHDVYSSAVLRVYDLFVLGFTNTFLWKCPAGVILELYNDHVSGNHMDVGVGTGYFLDKCRFPVPDPRIALVDLNPNSLQAASQRIQRYEPAVYQANVLEPLSLPISGVDSIGMNFLLHYLPGTMESKWVVFRNFRALLNGGGVLFGTTVLQGGVSPNWAARQLMALYNRRGIFSNAADDVVTLERVLRENFRDYSLRNSGCVASFTGRA